MSQSSTFDATDRALGLGALAATASGALVYWIAPNARDHDWLPLTVIALGVAFGRASYPAATLRAAVFLALRRTVKLTLWLLAIGAGLLALFWFNAEVGETSDRKLFVLLFIVALALLWHIGHRLGQIAKRLDDVRASLQSGAIEQTVQQQGHAICQEIRDALRPKLE